MTRRKFIVPVTCCALALMAALAAGCGGEEPAPETTGGADLVPAAAAPDSAAADSALAQRPESTATATAGTLADVPAGIRPVAGAETTGTVDGGKVNPFVREEAPRTVASGGGRYSLQLGSFTDLANAQRQVERLRGLGHEPLIEVADLGGRTYHRVFLRGLADQAGARELGERIHAELGISYLIRRTD